MNIVKRLAGLFSAPQQRIERKMLLVRVQCGRCGEIIEAPVDLRNDMSIEYDEKTGATSYICRKVLMGKARCYQQIEVTLHFDSARRLAGQETVGGKFLPAEGG